MADYIMNQWPEVPERAVSLGDLLDKAGVDVVSTSAQGAGHNEITITGLATDSRRVCPGDLFICLRGTHRDGHDFAQEALDRGAAAVLAERPLADLMMEDAAAVVVLDDIHNKTSTSSSSADASYQPPAAATTTTTTATSTRSALHAIANTFFEWPSFFLSTVGVTGTNGKTTSSWLIRSILEQRGLVVGMVGTIEYALSEDRLDDEGHLWVPREPDPTLGRACSAPYRIAPYRGKYVTGNTTPGALSMVKLLAGMRDRGAQAAVVECSSQGIVGGRLDGTDIDVAVFTNLSQEHLDAHGGSMEEYKEAKLTLFRRLGDPAVALQAEIDTLEAEGQDATSAQASLSEWVSRKRTVVNLDDPYVDEFRVAAGPVPCVTFGINDREADVWAEKVTKTLWESEIKIRIRLGPEKVVRCQIVTPLVGQHNVYNVLSAVATGLALGVPLEAIVAGVEAVDIVPGRMEVIDEGQGFPVIVDYAHTPDALSRLLDTVKECGAKRVITVLGCGGDRDRSKRPLMGEVAHYKSDFVFFTNDNPRTEEPNDIISEIVAGLPVDIRDRHAGSVFPWLQDRIRVPDWFEEFLLAYQAEIRRYVVEDRFTAIRLAIGTAVDRDVVVIAGKGHEDYIEYGDGRGGTLRGWFDDRVEARNALSKLVYLDLLTKQGVIVRSMGPPWRDRYGE